MTVYPEGLLLFMQGDGVNSDFFALQLMSGHLLFSYNLGSGRATFRSNTSYNDGLLHSVSSFFFYRQTNCYVVHDYRCESSA